MLSSGVGVVDRAVDPRSRCWSKERHSESHRIGGEAWAPGRGTDPAVVESSWAVVGGRGAGCGAGSGAGCSDAPLSLSFLQEIAGSRYQKVRKNRPRDANILSPILQLIRKEERFVTTYGYLKVLKNT